MKLTALLLILLASCGGAITPEPLPAACLPISLGACTQNGNWSFCPDADGTQWLIGPSEWGVEHNDASGCRLCRVWGEGAWATGPTADQEAHGCALVLTEEEE